MWALLDKISYLWQKAVFWMPVVRSGSNIADNYSTLPPLDYRVARGPRALLPTPLIRAVQNRTRPIPHGNWSAVVINIIDECTIWSYYRRLNSFPRERRRLCLCENIRMNIAGCHTPSIHSFACQPKMFIFSIRLCVCAVYLYVHSSIHPSINLSVRQKSHLFCLVSYPLTLVYPSVCLMYHTFTVYQITISSAVLLVYVCGRQKSRTLTS